MHNSVTSQAMLAGLMVSLIALVGVPIFLLTKSSQRPFAPLGISLSVGILLGDTFIHLLPDALEQLGDVQLVMRSTLGGILFFFLVEKAVCWHSQRTGYASNAVPVSIFAAMNLVSDGLHNFIDGVLIGGAFLISPEAGWATTLGIVVHELPQEVGDLGALVAGGYRLQQAVLVNLLCALTCLGGVSLVLLSGPWLETYIVYALPVTAGGFIYVAASDLIPELHRQTIRLAPLWQSLFISLGVGAMAAILLLE